MSAFDRTFRAGEHMASTVRDMLPARGRVVLVYVEPKTQRVEGGTRISIGFPALIVPDHVADPDVFAGAVVEALNADREGPLRELARMVEHFGAWAADHAAEATTETWAALECAREVIRKSKADAT